MSTSPDHPDMPEEPLHHWGFVLQWLHHHDKLDEATAAGELMRGDEQIEYTAAPDTIQRPCLIVRFRGQSGTYMLCDASGTAVSMADPEVVAPLARAAAAAVAEQVAIHGEWPKAMHR